MIDNQRVELFEEKITQIIKIRCVLIQRNTAALALIKKIHRDEYAKGLTLLNDNIKKEQEILKILKSETEEGLMLIQEFNTSPEEKYLGKKTKESSYSIEQIFEFFLNKTVPVIEKLFKYEELYFTDKSFIKEKFYFYMVKKVWNEKLLLENKIYKIIDEKKLEQNMDFQVSIDSNVKSIKIMPEKIKTIQKGKLKKKIFVSTLNHNIYPIIVYNPLAFRFLALNQIWILLRKHPYPRPSEAYQVLLQEQLMSFSLLIAYTR